METTKKKIGFGKKMLIAIVALVLIIIIANSGKSDSGSSNTEPAKSYPGIGQTLKTEYFEVTIDEVSLTKKIKNSDEFLEKKPDEGNQFLVMNTTFKNIDNESRMITDGSVFINYNGKEYEYDKSEFLGVDGYGLFLDQINPLTSKTTKLVYQIPLGINGPAYYKPGRADDDQKIFLGNLK